MLRFLLTSWWFYIPVVGLLLYLTRRNNQKIQRIQTDQPQAEPRVKKTRTHTQSAKLAKVSGKLGLKGASSHIRRK